MDDQTVKQETKVTIRNYAICVGVEAFIAFLVIWSKGFFTKSAAVNVQILADAFFVAGILMTLFAGMLYVSGEGEDFQKFSQLDGFLMERFDYKFETSITPAYSLLHHGVGDSRAFADSCQHLGIDGCHDRSDEISHDLTKSKLYHYEMWLDFTDGHVVPTTQEFEAELQQCIANREKKLQVLESVHDKASADAAAEFLREWEDAPYPPLMPYGTSDQTSNALFAVDVAFAESEICDNNCYGSSALKILLYTPKGKASEQNMELTPQEEEAYRQWRFQTTRKSTLRYVQMLQQELPRVHDRASALALAKKLYRLGGAQVYSHIDLLKPNPYNAPIDTLPIRRQLQRIKNAGYYGAIDLANILKERSGPSGPGYVEQMNDDVEPAESALP